MKRLGLALALYGGLICTVAAQMGSFFPGPGTVHSAGGGGGTPTFVWANSQDNNFTGAATSVAIGTTGAATACGTRTAGEVMIASLLIENTAAETITPPAGWTQIGTTQSDPSPAIVSYWWHIVGTNGETCSYTFSWTNATCASSCFMAWTLSEYSGTNATTPIDVSAVGTCATAGGNTCTTTTGVTTTATPGLLIALFNSAQYSGASTSPSGMTTRVTGAQEAGTAMADVSTLATSAGATGTKQLTGVTTFKTFVWGLVALKP